MSRITKLVNKIKNNLNVSYVKYCDMAIDDKLVLIEGGQGINLNGNMFAMLKEICTNPRWSDYTPVFVVTDKNMQKAQSRMKFYGFDNAVLCSRNSNEYCKYLATAKYLMTDNSFPPYFNKRDDQILLNTWHGTPLKTLGKSDKSFAGSMANIQKNYLMSDYALFPNQFTKDVFMDDYDLRYIFSGCSLVANYPRNYVFYDAQQGIDMKQRLDLADKQVFAYMPTWRGSDREASTKSQIAITKKLLDEFDSLLNDNQVLLVNLHFLLSSSIDCSGYKHIRYFDTAYDTYEVLNACDGLITDYSSVFFDYAVTGKKVVLFAYDKDEYLESRGVYIPFDSLPFPITETVADTVAAFDAPAVDCSEFIAEYCPNGSSAQCEDVFELMTTGASDKFDVVQHKAADDLCILYVDEMVDSQFDMIRDYINSNPDDKHLVVYSKKLNKTKLEFINSFGDNVSFFGLLTAYQILFGELVSLLCHKVFKISTYSKALQSFFTKEARRRFYHIVPKRIVDFSCGSYVVAGVLSCLQGDKAYAVHHPFFNSIITKSPKLQRFVKACESGAGFTSFDNSDAEYNNYLTQHSEDEFTDPSFRKRSKFKNMLPLYIALPNKLKCISFYSYTTPLPVAMKDVWLTVGDEQYDFKLLCNKNKAATKHRGIITFDVPIEKVVKMQASNKVIVNYNDPFGKLVQSHIYFLGFLGNRFLGMRSRMIRDKSTNTIAIFRQSTKNNLNVYVRSYIVSDKLIERFKQSLAFVLSYLWRGEKADNLILLFEKNSSKYEESASVTFEKLIDMGYKNAYFICDKNYKYFDKIPEKYLPNILYKNSFKHYLYFFKAKSFIGTETMVHSIDLKLFNIFALRKVGSKNINYVFLQHGVMYMVSLDSEARYLFRRRNLKGKYRVVVSSQAEADHFTQLGRHLPEDLYITGLPKFDKNVMSPDADKIVIMPTWRPWEINKARDSFSDTSYFKMTMRIFNSVPDELKDNVVILPHPLIVNELKSLPDVVSSKVVLNAKYDDILKQARILITDYSSIAYDAFYRGTRVIFYWEEKEECMLQYGPSTHLMLTEDNVFGDYFYNTDGLTESIQRNYDNPQTEENIHRYSKIVQFHDGRNTERLIEALKNDGIIK